MKKRESVGAGMLDQRFINYLRRNAATIGHEYEGRMSDAANALALDAFEQGYNLIDTGPAKINVWNRLGFFRNMFSLPAEEEGNILKAAAAKLESIRQKGTDTMRWQKHGPVWQRSGRHPASRRR